MSRVLVVSEIRLFRESLAQALTRDGQLEVVATASDGDGAVECVRKYQPDAALFDMGMQEALPTIRLIASEFPSTNVVALGVSEEPQDIVACAESGISGYLCRQGSLADLIAAVNGAVRNELACTPRVAAALLRQVASLAAQNNESRPEARLTLRELEIARLIDQGFCNKAIARRLNIQLSTVKNHVHNTLEKLGAQNRTEAAAKLRHFGMLRPPRDT